MTARARRIGVVLVRRWTKPWEHWLAKSEVPARTNTVTDLTTAAYLNAGALLARHIPPAVLLADFFGWVHQVTVGQLAE